MQDAPTQTNNAGVNAINAARFANVNAGRGAYSGAGATPYSTSQGLGGSTPVNNTPNATDVSSSRSLSVPTPPIASSIADGIGGAADTSMETHQSNLDKYLAEKTASDTAAKSESKSTLADLMEKYIGVKANQPTEEANAKIPEYTKSANDSFTALQASRRAQEKEVEGIQKNSTGMVAGAVNQAVAEVNRKYATEQADLSITLDIANRNLTSAQNMVDKKVALQLEPLKTAIDFQTTFFNDNKDQLNKDESAQLQNLISENTRQYEDKKSVGDIVKLAMTTGNADKLTPAILNELNSANNQTEALGILSKNGIDIQPNKFSATTDASGNPIAFNTKTGQFGSPAGGAPGVAATDIVSATNTANKSTPQNIGGQIQHPTTGNQIVDSAQQLVDGNSVPSLLSKRGKEYNAILNKANELSMAQTGKPYSQVDAESAYRFRNTPQYQKFVGNAPVALSTIDSIVADARKLNLKGPDLFNNYSLKFMASGFNPLVSAENRATAKELLNTLSAVSADDIGLLLGAGSGSDYKTKLGGAIFDVNGDLKTTEAIAQTVKERIQSKLEDYYKMGGVKDSSVYATRDAQGLMPGKTNGAMQTVKSNGQDWNIGQVYQDASGAKWTIDASGKWAKQ